MELRLLLIGKSDQKTLVCVVLDESTHSVVSLGGRVVGVQRPLISCYRRREFPETILPVLPV